MADRRQLYGTGSYPPLQNGWQRRRRRTVSQLPRAGPYRWIASSAYAEHVGWKRQEGGVSGEIPLW